MENEKFILQGPPSPVPYEKTTAGQQLYEAIVRHSNLPEAMINVHTGEVMSYTQLLEMTCKLAQSMQNIGLKKRSVISVCSENHLNFFCPIIAAMYIGVTTATLNENYSEGELIHALNISTPEIIFCSKKSLNKMIDLQTKLSYIKKIIILDSKEDMSEKDSVENFIKKNSDPHLNIFEFKPLDFDPVEEVALILCSSGTTGLPKGVMITHRNIATKFAHGRNSNLGPETVEGTTVLSLMPFFHGFGCLTNLIFFQLGIRVVMIQRFNAELLLQSIEKYKVETMGLVPPLLVFLVKSPLVENYNLTSIKEIACGAAPLGKDIVEAATKRLNLKGIRQGYGLTEATLTVTATQNNNFKPGSCGTVLPFMSAKVIDLDTGRALEPNQKGELCFKGPLLMKGYVKNKKATEEAIDKDGWLHTGDMGYYDRDGDIFIVDRLKELIKYKGFQVPPAELEALLLQHPSIKDAGVIGIPDEECGELPTALIVKQPGQQVTEKEICDFIAERVSSPKRLRGGVKFVEEIPRNPTGKIIRRELKKLVERICSKL